MDIEVYISSGILELYVLDQLSPFERTEVEQMCVQYSEVDKEILAIEEMVEKLAVITSIQVPNNSKEKVLADIGITAPKSKIIESKSLHTGVSKFYKYWAIAASIVITLGVGYLYSIYQKIDIQHKEIAELKQQADTTKAELAILIDPAYQKINLANVDTTKKGTVAQVFWNKDDQKVFIALTTEGQLELDKQYQLWALVDGKPIDAGVIENNTKLQSAKSMSKADAFAITIEQKGGSPTPTLAALVCIANV